MRLRENNLSMKGNETSGTSLPQIFIIATATTPDHHPLNRCYRASEDNTDASVTETYHPNIRFVSGGVGVPTTPASRYLRSG